MSGLKLTQTKPHNVYNASINGVEKIYFLSAGADVNTDIYMLIKRT